MTKLILKKEYVLSKLTGSSNFEAKFSTKKNQIRIGKVILDLNSGCGYVGLNLVLRTVGNKVVVSSYVYGSLGQAKSTINLVLNKLGITPDFIVNARYGLNRLDDSLFEAKTQLTVVDAELVFSSPGTKYDNLCDKRVVLLNEISKLKKVKELFQKEEEKEFKTIQVQQIQNHEAKKAKKLKEISQKEKVLSLYLKIRRSAENQFILNKDKGSTPSVFLKVNDSHINNHPQAKYFQSYNFDLINSNENWFFQIKTENFKVSSTLNSEDLTINLKTDKGEMNFSHMALFSDVYNSIKTSKIVEASFFEDVLSAIELLKVAGQVWFIRPTTLISKDIRNKQQEMEILRKDLHIVDNYNKFKNCSSELSKLFSELQNCRSLKSLFSDNDMLKIKSLLGL